MNIQDVFNESYFYINILVNSTLLRNSLESEVKIQSKKTKDGGKEVVSLYKRKLKSIYKIRNNAYAILLTRGFKCYKEDNILYMNLENKLYDCPVNSLKTILGNNYETIINKVLINKENIFNYEFNDVVINIDNKKNSNTNHKQSEKKEENKKESKQINNKEKNIEKKEPKKEIKKGSKPSAFENIQKIINQQEKKAKTQKNKEVQKEIEKIEKAKESISETNVEDVLDDFDSLDITEENIEKRKCVECGNELEQDAEICPFCGHIYKTEKAFGAKSFVEPPVIVKTEHQQFDIVKEPQKVFTREEMNELDNLLIFDESSLSKLDKPIEKIEEQEKLPHMDLKPLETIKKKTQNNKTANLKELDPKICDVDLSIPKTAKQDLIVDVYTLKVADPIDEEKKKEEEPQRRRKISDVKEDVEEQEVTIRDIKVYVFPLHVPENGNELVTDVMIYLQQDDKSGSYCSGMDGQKSVIAATDIHEFLIRGSWKQGKFTSTLLPSGKTLEQKCIRTKNVEQIRPNHDITNIGHPIIHLDVEYVDGAEKLIIHACPISFDNSSGGLCKTLYLTQKDTTKTRDLYTTKSTNVIRFQFEEELLSLESTWDNDEFKTSVSSIEG